MNSEHILTLAKWVIVLVVGLLANEGTTAPNTSWSNLDLPFKRAIKEGRIVAVAEEVSA